MTASDGQTPKRRRRWLIAAGLVVFLVPLVAGWLWLTRGDDFGDEVRRIGGRYRAETVSTRMVSVGRFLSVPQSVVFHWIDLEHGQADDAWLHLHREDFRRQSHLSLYVGNPRVTAEGLAALQGLENVHSVDLTGTPVDETAVETIVSLPNLVQLYVGHSGIPDSALTGLSHSPHLVFVCIDAKQATDAGINGLLSCPKLEGIWILDADNACVARLAPFNRLTSLNLHGAEVTADSLPAIKQLQRLRVLTFFDTNLSEANLTELRQAFPGCTVQQMDYNKIDAMREASWE